MARHRPVRMAPGEEPPVRVAALMMIRNEADILGTNVRFHRHAGITDFFIVDNGSTDATPDVLAQMAKELPSLRWTTDPGPCDQTRITSSLARDAYSAGIDWVVPIDADEFWSPGTTGFQEILEGTPAAALAVELVTFIQSRRVLRATPDCLLTMTRRLAEAKVPPLQAPTAVGAGEASFVEVGYTPKWICRSHPALAFQEGNHGVEGVEGLRQAEPRIECFHAPLRARSVLHAKAEHGRRLRERAAPPGVGWQGKRWADLEDAGKLYDDWAANSWRRMGLMSCIEPPEGPVPLQLDTRLRDAVRPFVERDASMVSRLVSQYRKRPAIA